MRALKIAHSVGKHNRLVARHSHLTAQLWTPKFKDQHAHISSLWSEIHQDILAYDVTDEVELGQLVLRVLEAEPLDPTEYERMCDSTDEEIADLQSDSEAATEIESLPQKAAELPSLTTLATTTTTSPEFKETTGKTEAPISNIDTTGDSFADNNESVSTPSPTHTAHQSLNFPSFNTSSLPNTVQTSKSPPEKTPISSSAMQVHVSEEDARLKESIMEARRQRLARESEPITTNNYDYNNNTPLSSKGSKKYQCKYCDSEFRHSKYYRRHLLTHQRPFACSFSECDKSYTRNDTLQRHVANVNKKQKKN